MPIYDIYSKRRKRESGQQLDILTYDLPPGLRVQIKFILLDFIGDPVYIGRDVTNDFSIKLWNIYEEVRDRLRREHKTENLYSLHGNSGMGRGNYFHSHPPSAELFDLLLQVRDVDIALDVVECLFNLGIETVPELKAWSDFKPRITPDEAVNDLNVRFDENAAGYQFVNGAIIRRDNQFIHTEIIKPALSLLEGPEYEAAETEFLSAHKHYRENEFAAAINECLKCFESVLKVICISKGWGTEKEIKDKSSKQLITLALAKGLIPQYLQDHYRAFDKLLENGLPTIRNKMSGHGAGTKPADVRRHMVQYALNLTATTVVFLIQSSKDL